jgi:transcriptional regulator with XRE-family HTH domain
MTSHIHKNLKAFRQANGWSQTDFANRLNISVPAFSKIETGITDPNITRLCQMAEILGVSVIDLISKPGEIAYSVSEVEYRECQAKLSDSQDLVVSLQQKVIMLYEEVRELHKNNAITA